MSHSFVMNSNVRTFPFLLLSHASHRLQYLPDTISITHTHTHHISLCTFAFFVPSPSSPLLLHMKHSTTILILALPLPPQHICAAPYSHNTTHLHNHPLKLYNLPNVPRLHTYTTLLPGLSILPPNKSSDHPATTVVAMPATTIQHYHPALHFHHIPYLPTQHTFLLTTAPSSLSNIMLLPTTAKHPQQLCTCIIALHLHFSKKHVQLIHGWWSLAYPQASSYPRAANQQQWQAVQHIFSTHLQVIECWRIQHESPC